MIDAAWEHLGVPCVYLLGRPQLLFQYLCIHVSTYVSMYLGMYVSVVLFMLAHGSLIAQTS